MITIICSKKSGVISLLACAPDDSGSGGKLSTLNWSGVISLLACAPDDTGSE